MAEVRESIQPTYDSRETGAPYWVRTWIGRKALLMGPSLQDPFVNHRIQIGLWDLLRGLRDVVFRRKPLVVEVLIGAPRWLMDDVLELDANQLVPGRTRQVEFRGEINQALRALAVDEELREMTGGAS